MADDYLALYRTCLPAVRPAVPTLVPLAPKSEVIGVQG
jgi:hypothetical protein